MAEEMIAKRWKGLRWLLEMGVNKLENYENGFGWKLPKICNQRRYMKNVWSNLHFPPIICCQGVGRISWKCSRSFGKVSVELFLLRTFSRKEKKKLNMKMILSKNFSPRDRKCDPFSVESPEHDFKIIKWKALFFLRNCVQARSQNAFMLSFVILFRSLPAFVFT